MLISVENITKYFGARPILKNICFSIEPGEHIGLIGANGCGKSTLLRLITGLDSFEEGEIRTERDAVIGYLAQDAGLNGERTVMEEMRSVFRRVLDCEKEMRETENAMAKLTDHSDEKYRQLEARYAALNDFFTAHDGYGVEVRIRTVLGGMGFPPVAEAQIVSSMSGGEKTRLALAKLLLEAPDLLILDEPTNHLDFKTLMWLEEYLTTYKGAVLVVSHDRYFLDRTVTRILQLENCELMSFKGNYSKYLVLKQEWLERRMKEYRAQQNEIASLQDYADRNMARASTSQSAKSRLKAIERMEKIEKPITQLPSVSFEFTFERTPHKEVFVCEDFGVTVGENKVLFAHQNFVVSRGDKVAFIGANGIGKSSLFKAMMQKIPHQGQLYRSPNTDVGFFDQQAAELDPENTVLEELWKRFPKMHEADVRSALGRVLLRGEEVYKKVGVISGGERARLNFAILMVEHPNVLLLDEPTNHLDLDTKEQLEKALTAYEGTLLLISHDRYLLNKIPQRIFEISDGALHEYKGNFDRYLTLKSAQVVPAEVQQKNEGTGNSVYYRSKQERAEQAKRKRRVETLEAQIEETEKKIALLEEEIASPQTASDYELLTEKCAALEEAKKAVSAFMEEWETLAE